MADLDILHALSFVRLQSKTTSTFWKIIETFVIMNVLNPTHSIIDGHYKSIIFKYHISVLCWQFAFALVFIMITIYNGPLYTSFIVIGDRYVNNRALPFTTLSSSYRHKAYDLYFNQHLSNSYATAKLSSIQ